MLKLGRVAFAFCRHVVVLGAVAVSLSLAPLRAATYMVDNTADGGPGSLRQAVIDANLNAGADTIFIDQALNGATIDLLASLPALTEKVVIDGPLGGSLTIRYVSNNDIFSGGFPLIKDSSGTLIFAGNNSYSGGTIVNGGALKGSSWSLKGDILNNGTVIFDQDLGDGTFAGNISGNGSLVSIGPWKLTLTGTNTYTGGTTVSAGLIQGDTNALQGSIVNNSAVIFDQAFKGTYAGNMTGTGQFAKIGTGTLILSGTNTYSGLTIASGGILQGNTSSLPSDIVNGSAVIFDQPFDGTYAGKINYRGSVTKEGAGTLTLTGANTYTGRTIVNRGALRGNSTSLQGNIINNAAVIFDQSFDGVYSDEMSGAGSLTKVGLGTLTLTGLNTQTGTTTVMQGRLAVTGQINGPVDVQGGTFAPAGMSAWVTDAIRLGGTPNAPTGTLDVGTSAVVVDYAAGLPNPSSDVRQQIVAARGGTGLVGNWAGHGITSSAAAADPVTFSVGYAHNADLPMGSYTTFGGRPVDATSVLIRGTRTGDATLDGIVDYNDVAIVAATFGMSSGAEWAMGDFDYDGDVDDNDITLVSALFNPAAAPALESPAGAGAGTINAVPEPSSLALLALGGVVTGALALRRRWA